MLTTIVIYVREFHRKKLTNFHECKKYYDGLSIEALTAEAKWLFGDDTKILPFWLAFQRYYALFDEMTERASCSAVFDASARTQFINLTIGVKEELLRRTPPALRERLAAFILDTCKRIKCVSRYKKAADAIRDSLRDYPGPFRDKGVIIHPGSETAH